MHAEYLMKKKTKKIRLLKEDEDLQALFDRGRSKPKQFSDLFDLTTDSRALEKALREKRAAEKPGGKPAISEIIRDTPPPDKNLDLHGKTAVEAEALARAFIHSSRLEGVQSLRIITGKGLHSPGHAVLPDTIETLLQTLKADNQILTYRWEKREKHKSGAVIVYL